MSVINNEEVLQEDQAPKVEPQETLPEETQDTSTPTVENKSSEEVKSNRREERAAKEKNYEKMYGDLLNSTNHWRSVSDKKYNELQKKLDGISQYESLLKKANEEYSKQELARLKQTNPEEYQNKLTEQAVKKALDAQNPQQNQQSNEVFDITTASPEQRQQYVVNVENWLNSTYGPENIKKYDAEMSRLLSETKESNIEEYKVLARRPDVLYRLAVADTILREEGTKKAKIEEEAKANQQRLKRFASGEARSSGMVGRSTKSTNEMSDDELIKAHKEELRRRYEEI